MLRLLFDQDFNHDILRGLTLRLPELDAMTAREANLDRATDVELLLWAASQGRVLLTHDANSMPHYAYQRIKSGELVAGVFVVPQSLPIGLAIAELEVLTICSLESEWDNLIVFLPL